MAIMQRWKRTPKTSSSVRGNDAAEAQFRVISLALVILLGAPALLGLVVHFLHVGLSAPDTLDYAQIARNLANGRGFTTSLLRPLALTHGDNPLHQPDVTHGPLYPFVLALAFGVGGAKDSTVIAVAGLCYLASVGLTYLLGKQLFFPAVGWIAAVVLMTSITVLENAALGTPLMLEMALLTGLFLLLHRVASQPENPVPRLPLALAGALGGLLYLVDPIFVWLLPIVAISVGAMRTRERGLALVFFLGPLLVLVLPWMVRNALITGDPIFGLRSKEIWMGTTAYPDYSAYRLLPSEITPGNGVLNNVAVKMLTGVTAGIPSLMFLPAGWILAFFLPCLFVRFGVPANNNVRRLSVLCLLGLLFGTVPFHVNPTLFIVVLPCLLVYSVAYLVHFSQSSGISRTSQIIASVLFSLALLCPLGDSFLESTGPARTKSAKVARDFARQSMAEDVSFSDQPWVVAWYADRPAIWLPQSPGKVAELRRRFKTGWLFLTDTTTGYLSGWQGLYSGLYQWNIAYVRAAQQKVAGPTPVQISNSQQPLLKALEGFAAVPPTEKWAPSAVIACDSAATR